MSASLLAVIALVDSGGHYHQATLDVTHEAIVAPESLALRVFLALWRCGAGQLTLSCHGLTLLWSVTYLGNGSAEVSGTIYRHGRYGQRLTSTSAK